MKEFLKHARSYVLRGLLAIIPLYLSWLAVKFIYIIVDRPVAEKMEQLVGFRVYGIGILITIVVLYFVGLLVSNVVGKQLFKILESIFNRIPILKTTYQVGKQLSDTFSLSEKQAFKQAVIVQPFQSGMYAIGFITGNVIDHRDGSRLIKVFIPHVPNPTSGFVLMIKEAEVMDPGWTVDEAIRLVISGGIIGPEEIRKISK
jgi:uncharacterized membrane protein